MNDSSMTRRCTWFWCDLHDQPVTAMDPAGDPYCWYGYIRGEVDECANHLTVVDLVATQKTTVATGGRR